MAPVTMHATERLYNTDQRNRMADQGKAMPQGSFPIATRQDLLNAIKLVGRAKDPAAAKRHIIARAIKMGLTNLLPADWQAPRAAIESIESATPVTSRDSSVTATAAEAIFTNSEDGSAPRAEIVIIRPGPNRSTGAAAKNYSPESIRHAVATGFWKGAPMFVDHGANPKMPKQRSARDLVSTISDKPGEIWLGQEGEARAMVDFYNHDWAGFAERAKNHIGISNNADIQGRRYRDTRSGEMNFQVDEFTDRHSVDWVAFPSAGGGVAQFITASESEDHMDLDWTALTAGMLAEHRPDLVTEIQLAAESQSDGDEGDGTNTVPVGLTADDIKKLIDDGVRTAQEAIVEQTRKAGDVRSKVGAKLATAGLPAKTRARLAEQFEGKVEYVEETVQEAIDEAKAELIEAGVRLGPKPTEFGAGGGNSGDDKKVIQLGQESLDEAPMLSRLMQSIVGNKAATKPTSATTGGN